MQPSNPPLCKLLPGSHKLWCWSTCAKRWRCPRRLSEVRRSYTWLDWLCVVLPMMRWVRTYKLKQYLLVRLCGQPPHALACTSALQHSVLLSAPLRLPR